MIDWDDVAADAENTPGSILTLFQTRVEDIDGLVVVARFKNKAWRVEFSGETLLALGLVAGAKLALDHELLLAATEDT